MLRLLSALAGCSGSTLAMLLGSSAPPEQLALGEFGEPLSVGDAVFQLLAMLAYKATSPQLILRPLFDFLSSGKLHSECDVVGKHFCHTHKLHCWVINALVGARIQGQGGQNLNESCISNSIKCHCLYLTFSVWSITLYDRYT